MYKIRTGTLTCKLITKFDFMGNAQIRSFWEEYTWCVHIPMFFCTFCFFCNNF